MLRLVGASAVVCALACLPSTAHAQSQQERDRMARVEFTAGREAFSHGDFRDAAARFEHAYQLSQRRELLYNIGTAYERLHRWAPARDAFREYLESFPNAPEREELNGRLAAIDVEIQHEEERARAAVAVSSPGPTSNTIVRERVVVREVPAEAHPLRIGGLVLGGLGLISGAASLAIGLLTNAHYAELVNTCGQTDGGCPAAVIDDVQLRATLTNVFAIGAGVLAAGAVVMVVLDMTRAHPSSASTRAYRSPNWNVGFAPARDGAGFMLTGAF